MNVHTLTAKNGLVVGVFDEDQLDTAKRIASDINGEVSDQFRLNKIHVDVPLDGKKYFELTMFKAGNFRSSTLSTLTEDGQRRPERYYLETYSKNRPKFHRKSHWRLLVHCYAKTENEAKDIARNVRKVIEKETRLSKGRFWRDLTTGEELEEVL